VPRRYEFVDELTKTYAGKIKHREIRSRFWAGRDVVV
jgi:acyl-coenzyme A synthetase/AMP-(fatty) acid ligase